MTSRFWAGISLGCFAWTSVASAGDHFLQMRTERTRCRLPGWDYSVQRDSASQTVVSEGPIPKDLGASFIVADSTVGPVKVNGVAGLTDEQQSSLVVSGSLLHGGGPVGLQQRGWVEVRVQGLTATGGAVDRGVVVCEGSTRVRLERLNPKTFQIQAEPLTNGLTKSAKIERIRVFLQYSENR
jgi:hypothetical protein